MSADYDVVVVGFGPSGVVATCLFGQAGLRVLAIDKSPAVWEKPRAIAIDHEILRVLQNLGVADAVLPFTAPFPASEHFGVEGQLIRRVDMVPPPYPLGYVPSMVFTQPPVEAALRAHAATYPSVQIALGVSFVSLQQSASGVRLCLEDKPGAVRDVTARYVVGCDGASSSVRQALGIAFEDLVFDEPWMVIDLKVNEAGLAKLPENAAQYCRPERPSTFIVGPGNHRRWEIMLLPGEDARAMEQPDNVWRLLSPWLGRDDAELWRASSYRFHALVAAEWRRGRVFLAGDAAHQQPPFIGQGMCQGIRDAANLGWKLCSVLKGEASDRLLDSYGAERSRHVRTLTARIKAIGHAVCERDPDAARQRDERLIAQGGGKAPTVTRQDIVPPLETGLLAEAEHSANGTLFPQPWILTEDGPRRLDEVAGTGWRLMLDGRHAAADTQVRGARTVSIGLHGLIEQDEIVARWFDRHGCIGAVVRPDHYVYGVMKTTAEVAPMFDRLQERIGR